MDKLKGLWSSKKKGFKGPGHVLGSAPPQACSQGRLHLHHSWFTAALAQGSDTSRGSSGHPAQRDQTHRSEPARPIPHGHRLGTGPPPSPSKPQTQRSTSSSSSLGVRESGSSTPAAPPRPQLDGTVQTALADASAELQVSFAGLRTDKQPGHAAHLTRAGAGSTAAAERCGRAGGSRRARAVTGAQAAEAPVQLVQRLTRPMQVFSNIVTKSAGPDADPKYRRLRLQNPKISAAIVDVDGGIETLQVLYLLPCDCL